MSFLGLDIIIWLVLGAYFAGMLALGWTSRSAAADQAGYLVGGRRFGTFFMIMHAFGAGTNPSDTTGTISKTVSAGASGIWVSWMWMFGTPFYWILAPAIRRMRCLTMADYFRERFNDAAAVLYSLASGGAMTIFFAAVLLGTTRTVQGMMGPGFSAAAGGIDWWFHIILFATTAVFMIYGYWGGIVAAIRTDAVQGLMIIVLSILAVPAVMALPEVGGLAGMKKTLADAGGDHLNLFTAAGGFSVWKVALLCVSAPLTALALPHLVAVTSSGRTEWEGRMGFTYGNMLKRICTIGWSVLGLCWLAYLLESGQRISPDAAFGDCIRHVLSPAAQGLMLACVMAAAMSSGDAVQVTVAGLFTRSVYSVFLNPGAGEERQVAVTRLAGLAVITVSVILAVLMRNAFVESIVAYFRVLSFIGAAAAMGILWRRMNSAGVFCCILPAIAVYIFVKLDGQYHILDIPSWLGSLLPLVVAFAGGIAGSLATLPPDPRTTERFFAKMYVPIGKESEIQRPLSEVVPVEKRLCTAGGLFIVKPSRQSWVGFMVAAALCAACVVIMRLLLHTAD